ncbi:HORMA domain-containing protein 2 [Camelus dromedarius]|uniref:HORMA domain-containing protein 2 n=2 Tax=Camelus dromedarius TaxID=9838 RepID=A0A5N4C8X6_CAMDR|nr:HORMA domain-containing protein 2 [Camelus dromedarius]
MQNLGPLPNDVILTMKLHYYNAVTPHDYQPPGFKEGVNSHFLLFEGEPVNLQVGLVSTGFHSMKVKVTTEATRVSDLENNLFQESSTTEIAHQGLDCDEEEEECDNHVRRSLVTPRFSLTLLTFFGSYTGHIIVRVQYSVLDIKTKTRLAPDLKESLF